MADQSLLERISSVDSLITAWKGINKSHEDSKGLSGLTIEAFAKSLDARIPTISSQLNTKKYKFSKNRAAVIQKDNGKYRPLQIPEVYDRVVLKSLASELEVQFKTLLEGSKGVSFAYQKHLGVKDAIDKMKSLYDSGFKIILEADIINFFGEVDKKTLLETAILPKLQDDTINLLLIDSLNQEIGGIERLSKEHRSLFNNINAGIPQGNALSPLLSNIYLAPFDRFMIENGFNLVRYADDFIVLCRDFKEAEKCYKLIFDFLKEKLNLRLHPIEEKDKTRIVDPCQDRFSFLSIEFNGKDIFPSEKSVERFKTKIRSICHDRSEYPTLLDLSISLRNCIDGWVSAFFYTQIERYEKDLEALINRQIYFALEGMTWKLTKNSLTKVPYEYREKGQSNLCLSQKQRINSGVPLILNLAKLKREINNAP
jgi:RNA-directed DNA polymerase